MAKFKPYKLLESQLDSLPIQEGQFILTTDTNKLYSDTAANTRILISPDAITDLSVNGTTITYTRLDGTTGTITTKDTTYSVASVIKNGLMSASDKEKLDTIEKGAQANTVTGVKGDSESLYRTGNVNITKTNIGLNNVENKSSATIRGELTNSNVTTALGYTPLNSSLKGVNNGLAELDASGKVPASQLPSYVDDVLEYSAKANFPTTGETGKIYVDTSTNKTYRWGGSAYVEISPSIVLGTTSSTAFRGDYGQIAYTHAVTNKGSKFDSGLYKIATNAEGHVTDATEVAKSDITALGIPAQDTTYNAATTSVAGLMSSADKTKLDGIAAGAQKNTITGVKGSAETNYRIGNVNITAANIGLGNVENKSSETIREELTKTNITTALGYTPPTIDTDTTYTFATGDSNGTIKVTPSSGSAQNVSVKGLGLLAYKSSLVASDVDAIASSLKGVANGVAELDENGLVPSSQLPSYVDDVLEYDTKSDFPSEGESGKIYIDISTNQTYRWSGSTYAVISETLALGETSSTAYRGDRGKVSYDHSQTIGNPHQTTKADIGLENVDNTADADKVVKEAKKTTGTLTIQKNGTNINIFNGSSDVTANISVPTKTSELTNDSGFITSGGSITGNAATATSATSAGTSTKAEQDIKGQKIDETYIKALAVSGTTITYTKGDNSTGTIKTQDTNTTYGVATQTSNGLMSSTDKTKLDGIESGAQVNTITGVKGNSETSYRTGNINITKANIGLGNVENKSSATIRGELTASNITMGLGYTPLNSNLKGAANGLAELNSDGKVPAAQLPSYVDDVLEYNSLNIFPSTGESGKIYVDTSTNLTYRWSGSGYVIISSSLALGETSSTAYRGDRGKTAYDHSQKTSGNPHKVTKSDVGLGNVDNTADANKTVKEAKKTTGTLTIQKNGTNIQTFNGSSNITANIIVPTKVSELSNDSGYLTTHQDITGKTNTSVLPNDNGEIKTKFRISNKGYTGSGSTVWYYPLCKFPSDNAGNYASAIISGRIGGWVNSNMSSINALCWNRNSTGIALFDIAGGASSMSNIWNTCDIVIYTDANATTDTVYLKCTSYFTFDLDLELFQSSATILYNGSYLTTEPTGTLNAKASTTTKRVEIINGEMYIAGHKALTANNYTNYTTSKANTIKSLSVSGKTLTYTKGDDTTGSLTTQDTTYSDATQTVHGLMSTTDKKKLDGIATGATANSASSTTPKVAGTAAVGSETSFARGDHVHPAQTTVSGNAGTATKLATARTINGVSFDGSANITITANPTTTTLISEDLDDVKTPGLYNANSGNTTTNKPSGIDAYGLFVYKTAGGYATQELTSGNINSLKKYIRQYTNSWSDWKNIVEDNGIISSNDTIKNIVTLTKSEYDDLTIKERNTLYNITDDISEGEHPDSDSSISITKVIDIIYPVGSIYISANTVNPSTFLGGTWERIKDTFLWAAGDDDIIGSTGGEKTHTLTIDEIPSHTHIQNSHSHEILSGYGEGSPGTDTYRYQYWAKDGRSWKSGNLGTSSKTATNQNTGGGKAHNNMPPYLAVYIWKRLL